jgi:diguanylate cyclase (GGDEF)-like protein
MPSDVAAEARSDAAADRLLEETWEDRSRRISRRELVTEGIAAVLFLAGAAALLVAAPPSDGAQPALAAGLVALYAVVALVEFPVGAGYVMPTQLVLVPMLLLLPPATVPPLVALGYVLSRVSRRAAGSGSALRVLFSVADAWYAIGPAAVLVAAGSQPLHPRDWPLLVAALVAAGLVDAGAGTVREAGARGIAPRLQIKVLALVWVVDAALAPVGVLAAAVGVDHHVALLGVLPLAALLMLLARDRNLRIERAQEQLELATRERARLQSAVRRMGDAFASRLDLDALIDILVRGSIEAVDADAGWLALGGRDPLRLPEAATSDLDGALRRAGEAAMAARGTEQVHVAEGWALALPFTIDAARRIEGAVCIARAARPFQDDEVALLGELVGKGQSAAADFAGHHALREQAMSDPMTGLANRRRLAEDLTGWLSTATASAPRMLMLFDLDGFKAYNDTFGHPAGDALLTRLGAKLRHAVATRGHAYRLGGDEFCAVLAVDGDRVEETIADAVHALTERGDEFSIAASYGVVVLPHEAETLEQALLLADQRMYSQKRGRSGAREQARDVLMRTMQAKQPGLRHHASEVAQLAIAVGRRLGMSGEELDEIARAAELHDVGKVGIPDAILDKPTALDATEWAFMYQHTILGERILNAAPALRPVARIVRSSHERWDGLGYPDGLRGEEIPRGARVVAVCDAFEAMTSDRAYRPARSLEAACRELRAMAGTQFDPDVVEAFLREAQHGAVDEPDPTTPEAQEDADMPLQAIGDHVRALLATTQGPVVAPDA